MQPHAPRNPDDDGLMYLGPDRKAARVYWPGVLVGIPVLALAGVLIYRHMSKRK